MYNKIAGYRRMLGLTQKQLADILNISKQAYYMKENGKTSFSDEQKRTIKNMLVPIFPSITIDEIFFS